MKLIALSILLLTAQAVEFETFQQALNFDPQSLSAPNCGNDDSFTQQYEAYFPWIQLIEEGEIDMQEDHSVLTQAKEKFELARQYISNLDKDIDSTQEEYETNNQQQASNEQQSVTQQEQQQEKQQEQTQQQQQQQQQQQDSNESNETDSDDPFGWGEGEIPQMLVHKDKKQVKHGKHEKALVEVMNKSKSLKFKSKIRKLIAMASTLDTDMGTQDINERRQRKIELCDLIINELVNMIDFLEQVQNDINFQEESLATFRKKQEEIAEVATGCGSRIISLQDTYSTSFIVVKTQPKPKLTNQKKEKSRRKKIQ